MEGEKQHVSERREEGELSQSKLARGVMRVEKCQVEHVEAEEVEERAESDSATQ